MVHELRHLRSCKPALLRLAVVLLFAILSTVTSHIFAATTPFPLELLVKDGDPATGTTGTLNLGRLTETSLATSCGTAFFYAESTQPGAFSPTTLGIWAGSGAGIRDIAIDGQILPGFQPAAEDCVGVGSTCGEIFRTSGVFYVSPVGDVLLRTSRDDNVGPVAYLDGTTNSNLSPVLTSTDTTFANFPNQTFIALKTASGKYLIDQYIGDKPFGEPDGGLVNFVTPLVGSPPPFIADPVTVTDVFGNYFSQSGITFGFNQNGDRLYGVEWVKPNPVPGELVNPGQALYFHGASDAAGKLLARTGDQVLGIAHGEYIKFTESITFGTIGRAQVNDNRTGFYVAGWVNPSEPISGTNSFRRAIIRFNIVGEGSPTQQLVVSERGSLIDPAFPTSEFSETIFDKLAMVQVAANGDIWFFAKGWKKNADGLPDRSDERVGLWRKRADNDLLELVWRYTTSDTPGSRLPDGPNVPGTPLPDGTFFVGTGSGGFGFDEHSHIVFAGPKGLYAEDSTGMRLVVAQGQQVEVAPGDIRTVREIIFNPEGHVSGVMQSYRDDQLIFMLRFTDDTDAIFAAKSDAPGANNGPGGGNDFIVNSTGDADDMNLADNVCDTGGQVGSKPECTLRAAITQSNVLNGKQLIGFSIPSSKARGGVFKIEIKSHLPVITDPVIIDATSQCGYRAHAPVVELNARFMGKNPSWGFQISAGDSTIKGFWINQVSNNAILIETGGGNKIQSNVIGTNIRGDIDIGTGEDGVFIRNSSENIIGGVLEDDRNVISNNGGNQLRTQGVGLKIEGKTSTANKVLGNFIGTDVSGNTQLGNGNGSGIFLFDTPGNFIGGSAPNSGNVISGNQASGILIRGSNSQGNLISGNIIGLDVTARHKVPNGSNGVFIFLGVGTANVIGGFTDFPGTGAGNIISGNNLNGILIRSPGQVVLGNIVGTNLDGLGDQGNALNGIHLESEGNTVGTGAGGSRNILSGNTEAGIFVNTVTSNSVDRNFIDSNFIGTNVTGTARLPNKVGIMIKESASNEIGLKAGNLISGNTTNGILVTGRKSTGNKIENNQIGGGSDGKALGNTTDGIKIFDSSQNRIGPANTIQSNGKNGIVVIRQSLAEANTITRNKIFSNTGLGIDLEDDGVTANDALDQDDDANGLQNFPNISRIIGSPMNLVMGSLASKANRAYTIEVFHNTVADAPSGYGEGELFQSAVNVITDSNGLSDFTAGFIAGIPGDCISTTATDILTGDTSEFSECIPIPPPPPGGSSADFGDAPDSYPTRLSANGARHQLIGGLFLGTDIDAEQDGQPTTDASGDNNNGNNDEQGVVFAEPIFKGSSQIQIEVTASGPGMLDAWIDFNNDGDWDDTSEQILTSESLVAGVNLLRISAPSDAIAGPAFARFRLSASGKLTPAGPALSGEVEDYLVNIIQPPVPLYNLKVATSPVNGGFITAQGINCPGDCGESYQENSLLPLTANAATGFQFLGWGDDLTGLTNPQEINMDADKSVKGFFGSTASAGTDGDGIPDTTEMGPQGNNLSFDGNNDGIPDYQQGSVASLPANSGGVFATLAVPDGLNLNNVSTPPNPSPADAPAGSEFPYGFFNFDITGLSESACTTLTMFLPPETNLNSYFKYGPTPDNSVPHWYEFVFDGQTGVQIFRDAQQTRIILYLCDGLVGDADLIVNGIISDPGAPAIFVASPTSVTEKVPMLTVYGLILLLVSIVLFLPIGLKANLT